MDITRHDHQQDYVQSEGDIEQFEIIKQYSESRKQTDHDVRCPRLRIEQGKCVEIDKPEQNDGQSESKRLILRIHEQTCRDNHDT
jgi:hypothetical protein